MKRVHAYRTETPCIVANLADQYEALAKTWEAADKDGDNDRSASLQEAMNGIVDAASYLTPASAKGVAFQVMAAASQADSIRTAIQEWRRKAAEQCLERLLHRVMQRVGADDDMPNVVAHLMPWRHRPEGKQQ